MWSQISFIFSLRIKKSLNASGFLLGSRRIAAGCSIAIISTPFFSMNCRYSSEADDNFRADELDLVAQPVNAHLLLLGLWIAVFGRAALYDICDIDILVSVKVDCNQHFIEELACSADKGLALKVLVFSGTLAYEHYLGVRSAHSDNNVGSCLAQLAFLAVCAGVKSPFIKIWLKNFVIRSKIIAINLSR